MADPLAPQDIARASFDTARRGYEQQAVRGFLHEVAALVDRLTRSEKELREQLQRTEARLGSAEQPDEATLLEVLGAETTRVLTSAHEAATDIRSKAEAAAERVIAAATSEAADIRAKATREIDGLVSQMTAEAESLREAARTELELRKAEAHAAAERIQDEGQQAARALREDGQAALELARQEAAATVEAAQQRGREMVAEAQTVRERVLRDLAVRRKRARQQVEKLNAGRERLLLAYETVRGTLDEATTELNVSLADARIAANAAALRVDQEPETTLEQLDAEVAAAGLADLPIAELDLDDYDESDDLGSGAEVRVEDSVPERESVTSTGPMAVDSDPPGDEVSPRSAGIGGEAPTGEANRTLSLDDRRGRKGRRKKGFDGLPPAELTVVQPPRTYEGVRILSSVDGPAAMGVEEPPVDEVVEVGEVSEDLEADPVAEVAELSFDDTAASEPAVADDVFARLRGQTDAVPATEPATEVPATEVATEVPATEVAPESGAGELIFATRAAAIEPIEKELRKRLKRALADEQNEVLDLLRRSKPKGVDDLLPDAAAHASRWAEAAAHPLGEAAVAGASSVGGTTKGVSDLADELAQGLTGPLRERIERSFAASDGNLEDVADRVRALYREWKGQRLSEASANISAAAYARGVFDAIEPGAKVRWVIDPSVGACPDCDDNVLAGAISKGDDFPTGNPCAPAHPGCHCLVLVQAD